ncbi:hypothetical protein BMSBPS_p0030 (plasmid) [Candidatus Pantoea carbekii]|nr:hypothetical protein BMSBPS_p0030 [Candidatus Pantoea carbekii]
MKNIITNRINSHKIKMHFEKLNNCQKDEDKFFKLSITFLQLIWNERLLPKIIKEILIDENYLKEISSNSYRHVNHFSKISLINDFHQDHCRLTLHIWKPPFTENEVSQELIHDHRFSFSSHVLCGKQIHEIFTESSKKSITKIKLQKYKYLPSKTSNIHNCFFEKYVYLDKIDEKIVNCGHIYNMKNELIHRIVFPNNNEPIISFMVRGPRKRNFSHTYNTFYPRSNTISNVPMYSSAELKKLLTYTLDKM